MTKSESGHATASGEDIDRLRDHLAQLDPGRLTDHDKAISLLQASWGQFDGCFSQNTTVDKLDRAEDVAWNPPCLSFTLERHGGTAQGSSRAELYRWEVDLDTKTASCGTAGHRQMRPQDKRLDVCPLAAEIAAIMLGDRADHRIKRFLDGHVNLLISSIIPHSNAQTTKSRRERFRLALTEALGSDWTEIRANSYRRVN